VHLDIHTDDLAAEIARLEELGASRVQQVHSWWILRDPAGLLFVSSPSPRLAQRQQRTPLGLMPPGRAHAHPLWPRCRQPRTTGTHIARVMPGPGGRGYGAKTGWIRVIHAGHTGRQP
jgi:hypothetical protein